MYKFIGDVKVHLPNGKIGIYNSITDTEKCPYVNLNKPWACMFLYYQWIQTVEMSEDKKEVWTEYV